jgi:hypothetical protein
MTKITGTTRRGLGAGGTIHETGKYHHKMEPACPTKTITSYAEGSCGI